MAAVGTAHLHGTLQSCLGLPVSGLLHPLSHLPHGTQGEGGQSDLQVEEPQAGSTTNALCGRGGVACPLGLLCNKEGLFQQLWGGNCGAWRDWSTTYEQCSVTLGR